MSGRVAYLHYRTRGQDSYGEDIMESLYKTVILIISRITEH